MEIFFMINFLKFFDFSVGHVGTNNIKNQLSFIFSNLRKISRITGDNIAQRHVAFKNRTCLL